MTKDESKPLRILMVEDDESVVQAVRDGLGPGAIELIHAATIAQGKRHLGQGVFDAVILDLNLPDGDGAEIAVACREAGSPIPILMITAKDSVDDRIAGLGLGADDYICKPFAIEELSARLEAVLRRYRRRGDHVLRYADVELDLLRRSLKRSELEEQLSAREVDLLAFLLNHAEEVMTKEQILKAVWGDDDQQDSNVLHVYANYLRNKMEGGRYSRLLHTVRGIGYVLAQEEPG